MADYYTKFGNMSDEDYNTYKSNKYTAEKYGDADGSLKAENDALRSKYNIKDDLFSYDQLDTMDRVNALGQNNWDREADARYNELNRYKNYNDKYAANVQRAYDELKNFRYNPADDPNYKVYADMYARQGAAAQDKTYSNLTALSGGRNNSWASAATAQVGQAYAQKTADMIPQLAEQAYNKLLQQYNIDVERSDRDYSRFMDKYNIDSNLYGIASDRANMYRDMLLNQENFDMTRQSWLQDYNLNEKYGDAERAEGLEAQRLSNEHQGYINQYTPEQYRLANEAQRLGNEYQTYVNRYVPTSLYWDNMLKQGEYAKLMSDLNNSGGGGRVAGDYSFVKEFIDSVNYNSAYKDRMIYQMFNDDSITNEQRQYLMEMFDITYEDVDKLSNSKSLHGDMR